MNQTAANPTDLAQQYLPLLASIVRAFCRRFPEADRDEVYQNGAVGLMQAAHRCRPEPLGPLARLRIRGAILDGVKRERGRKHQTITGVPDHVLDRPARSSCELEQDVWWAEQLEGCTAEQELLITARYRLGLNDDMAGRLTGVPRRLVRRARNVGLSDLYRQLTQ